jgi:very-short-patch-repair endonuclease
LRQDAKLARARELRRNETLAERRMWEQLRNRSFEGFKFTRQVPVGPYIVDFLCRETRLVVEIDGETHSTDGELARDSRRTAYLAALGLRVIRFQNEEVVHGMDGVLTLLSEALRFHPRP